MFNSDFCHSHADVLGVRVSAINLQTAVRTADRWISEGHPGFVCVTSVHGIMQAQSDLAFRRILTRAVMTLPDGMPLTWVGRMQGFAEMDRVFGADFMMAMCRRAAERGYRIFLYGGEPGVAQVLSDSLQKAAPGLQVAGTYTPPFGPLNSDQEHELIEQVRASKPHILWVGISTPKQERFMAEYCERLQVPLMVGVGAAFDFNSGRIRDCAEWIKRAGLQWLHRMIQDPKRLWRRYLVNNSAFLWRITWQLLGIRNYSRVLEHAEKG